VPLVPTPNHKPFHFLEQEMHVDVDDDDDNKNAVAVDDGENIFVDDSDVDDDDNDNSNVVGDDNRNAVAVAADAVKQEMPVARARVSRTGESGDFTTLTCRAAGAVQSALGVGGRGREIFAMATCSLQFAKAGSAATLPQQEKNNSADVQRGSVNIASFI
jgi:hypothetical protein